jgi:hypothetical protein
MENTGLLGSGLSIGTIGTSVAIGAGAVLLAPVVIPIIGGIVRPLAKAAIKGSLLAYEGVKVTLAETKETVEDLAAEAKSEIAQQQSGGAE